MEKIKLLYILSDVNKSLAFEWIASKLNPDQFQIHFILINQEEPEMLQELRDLGVTCDFFPYSGKKSYPFLFFKIIAKLLKLKPDRVHTHLFLANVLGLSAAWIMGVKKRIYTRHHSSFHLEYMPKAVKWDRLCNFLATDIVAISENVKSILLGPEGVKPSKVHLIHHGFDLDAFAKPDQNKLAELRLKYQIQEGDYPIVGMIARQIEWKGIQYAIPAFKELLEKYPKAKIILANATGPYQSQITKQLTRELDSECYVEIKFESELFALYQLFDLFVHVPINAQIEAFGQVYVESLAAGIPSVFTASGVATEFIKHEKNALLVDYCSSEAIFQAMCRILEDKILRDKLVVEGKASISAFALPLFIERLNELYGKS